jgi:hypothetical protein
MTALEDPWVWPPVGEVEEPLRTPLWVIRTLAAALADEEQGSEAHRQHVARQIARTAEQLEQSLAAHAR